ncbi:MAG: hypothetical protein QM605_06320 [Sphingobium sp.]
MRAVMILAVLLTASACEQAKQDQLPVNHADGQAMNYAAEIGNMPEASRDAALFRAIRDAGLPCQRIVGATLMPDSGPNTVTWRARCEDDAYHLINIQPDGSAMVVSRTTP